MERIYSTTAGMKKGTKRLLAIALAVLMMFTNLGDVALGVVALASEETVDSLPLAIDPYALQEKLDAIVSGEGEEAELVLPSYGDGEEAAALDEKLREEVAAWREGKLLLDVVTFEEDANVAALVAVTADGNTITGLSIIGVNTGSRSYVFATSLSGTEIAAAQLTTVTLEATRAELPVGASDTDEPESSDNDESQKKASEDEAPDEIPVGVSSLVASSVVSKAEGDLPVGGSAVDSGDDGEDEDPVLPGAVEVKTTTETKALDESELSDLSGSKASFFRSALGSSSYGMPVGASGISGLDIQPMSYGDTITITNHVVGTAPAGTTFTYQLYTGSSSSNLALRDTFVIPANGSVTKVMGYSWGSYFKVVQTAPSDINTYVAVGDARYYEKQNASDVSTISDGTRVGFVNAYATSQAPSLSGDKTVTDRSEGGLYDITAKMEVSSGFEIPETPIQTPAPAQVILLLDLSNSMKYGMSASGSPELAGTNPEQRWYVTREAAKSFITSILGNGNPANNEIAIIGFYSYGNNNISGSNVDYVTTLLSDYSSNIDSLLKSFYYTTNLNDFRGEDYGGTNVQAGLRRARNLLASATNDPTKAQFLILMSDGEATSSISYSDKANIPNVSDTDSRRAGWEADQIKSERPDVTICTVGIGNSAALGDTAKRTLQYIASNPTSDTYLLGENIEQLTARFNQLVTLISRYQFNPIKNQNVTLTDTMSQYVELVHPDGSPITAEKPFNEATDVVKSHNKGTVTYDIATKTLTWTISGAVDPAPYLLTYHVNVLPHTEGFVSGDGDPETQVGSSIYTALEPAAPSAHFDANASAVVSSENGGSYTLPKPQIWQKANVVKFQKVGGNSATPLAGVTFEAHLGNASGPVVASATSDENGYLTMYLYDDFYVITERPTIGYIGINPITADFTGKEGRYGRYGNNSTNSTITTNEVAPVLNTDASIPASGMAGVSYIRVKNDRAIDGKVTVTKNLLTASGTPITPVRDGFYVGLFTKDGSGRYTLLGNSESPNFVNPLPISTATATAEFTNVPYGIYYVLETDSRGVPVDKSTFNYTVTDGAEVVVNSKNAVTAAVTNKENADGSLTVTKTLTGTTAAFANGKEFTFKLYKGDTATGNALHTGTASFDGTGLGPVTVRWDTADGTLSGLSYGAYTVAEESHAMFQAVGGAAKSATITISDKSKTIAFTNAPKTDAQLTIKKVVTEHPQVGAADSFSFRLYTRSGDAMTPVGDRVTVTVGGSAKVFNLTYGQTYYVKEEDIPTGYELVDSGMITVSGQKYYAVTIDATGKEVTFTNTAKTYNNTLRVTKNVSDKWLLTDDAASRTFSFKLNGPGIPEAGITANVTVDKATGTATATFAKPEGGWRVGEYTIAETATPGSAYDLTGITVSIAGKTMAGTGSSRSVTLTAADFEAAANSTITFTAANAVKTPGAGTVTATKTLANGAWLNNPVKSFGFTLTGPDGFSKTFSVPADGTTATLTTDGWDMPLGQYTLTETKDPDFKLTANGLSVAIGGTAAGSFSNGKLTFTLGSGDIGPDGKVKTIAFAAVNEVESSAFTLNAVKELRNTTASFASGKSVTFTLTGPNGQSYTGTATFDGNGLVEDVTWSPELPASLVHGEYTLSEALGNENFKPIAVDPVVKSGDAAASVSGTTVTFTVGAANAGKTLSVKFINEPQADGSLNVSKAIADGSKLLSAEDTFVFDLYEVSGSTAAKLTSIPETSRTITGAGSVTITGLTRGKTYLVAEQSKDGYRFDKFTVGGQDADSTTVGGVTGWQFTVSGSTAAAVTLVNSNTQGPGFTLTKSLNTNGLDTETFTFNLYKGSTLVAVGATGSYTGSGAVKTADVTWTTPDGKQPFDVTLMDVGTYTINEVVSQESNYKFEKFTDGAQEVTANSYTFTVTGSGSAGSVVAHNGPDTVEGRTVTVNKTLESGFGLVGSFSFAITDASDAQAGTGSVAVGENGLTKADATKAVIDALADLPNGVYTVTETITGDFELDGVTGASRVGTGLSATFTLTRTSGNAEITFTNKAKSNTGFGVTVNKIVDSVAAADKEFTFLLTQPDGTIHTGTLTKTIAASEPVVTWSPALPTAWEYGEYTVTETDSGDYTLASITGGTVDLENSTAAFTVGAASAPVIITFTNNRTDAEEITLAKEMASGSALVNSADTFDFVIYEPGVSGSEIQVNGVAAGAEATAVDGLKVGTTYYIYEKNGASYTLDGITGAAYVNTNGSGYKVYSFTVPSSGIIALTAVNSNTTGGMTLQKVVAGENFNTDARFAITVSGAGLTGGSISSTLKAGGTASLSGLRIGETYTVTEADAANYQLVGITIEKGGNTLATLPANGQFTMAAEYVGATIKVTNKMPVSGAVTVTKTIENAPGYTVPSFGFNLYQVSGDPAAETLIATASTRANGTLTWTVAEGKSTIFNGQKLLPGTYRVRENQLGAVSASQPFALTGITGGTADLADRSATFTVAEGDTAAIGFTNSVVTWDGEGMDVVKAVTNGYGMEKGQTFQFTISGPAEAENPSSYAGEIAYDAQGQQSLTWTDSTRTFAPGTYTITETNVPGSFDYVSIGAASGSTPVAVTPVTGENAVTFVLTKAIMDAEDLTITITNTPKTGAGLTLTKALTANGLADETFAFTLTGATNEFVAHGTVTGSGTVVWDVPVATLPVGSYTLTEDAMASTSNFRFEKFTVDGVDDTDGTVSFDVAAGDTTAIAVTASNTVKADGSVAIAKNADTKDFEDTFTFALTGPVNRTITINSADTMTGSLSGLPYGTYTLTENSSTNFTFDEFSVTDGAEVSRDGKTLTFTIDSGKKDFAFTADNALKTGSITIQKTVAGSWGDITAKTFSFDLYQKQADGTFAMVNAENAPYTIAMTASGDQTLSTVASGMEYGVYKVVERSDSDFRLISGAGLITGDVDTTPEQTLAGNSITFSAQNELRTATGEVRLTKTAPDAKNLADRNFTFQLKKGDAVLYTGQVGSHDASVTGGALVLWQAGDSFDSAKDSQNYVSGLQIGSDYSIVEVSPAPDFTGAAAQTFTVTEDMENLNLTMANTLGSDGKITVNKVFEGLNAFPGTDFTFTVTGPIVEGQTPAERTLTVDGDTLTGELGSLPYGTYRITEDADANYTFNGFETVAGVTLTDGSKTAEFTIDGAGKTIALTAENEVKSDAALTLSKIFANSYVPYEDSFTFTLTGPIVEGQTPATKAIELTTENLTAALTGLPYGTYTLAETNPGSSYQFESFTGAEGAQVSQDGKTLTFTLGAKDGQNTTVEFTARNEVLKNGTLTVENVVDSKQNPYPDQDFTFTVTVPEGSSLKELQVENGAPMAVTEGKVTFTLKDGGSVKFVELPLGSYVVEEASGLITGDDRYDFVGYTQETDKQLNPTTAVLTSEVPNAVRTAHNDIRTDGSIRVAKEMASGSVVQTPGQLFTFELYQGEYTAEGIQWSSRPVDAIEIQAGRSATFTGLIYGVPYQVREKLAVSSVYQLVSFSGGEDVFEFVPTVDEDSASTIATNLTKLGDLNVRKYGSRSGKTSYLQGAGFTLYRYDGGSNSTVIREQQLTDANGYTSFQDLPAGKYVLKETKVPSRYRAPAKSDMIVELKVDAEGQIIVVAAAGVVMEDKNTVTLVNTYRSGGRDDDDDDDDPTPGVVIIDPLLPLGNLPNAGGIPVGVLSIIGSGLAFAGWAIGRKSKDDEDEDE